MGEKNGSRNWQEKAISVLLCYCFYFAYVGPGQEQRRRQSSGPGGCQAPLGGGRAPHRSICSQCPRAPLLTAPTQPGLPAASEFLSLPAPKGAQTPGRRGLVTPCWVHVPFSNWGPTQTAPMLLGFRVQPRPSSPWPAGPPGSRARAAPGPELSLLGGCVQGSPLRPRPF